MVPSVLFARWAVKKKITPQSFLRLSSTFSMVVYIDKRSFRVQQIIAESTSKSTWFLFPTAIHSSLYIYSLLSECPVTCDLGLSSVYLGLAESSFGLTLPIFPTIIFYLCFNLCLTLCLTYFTYVKLCLTYALTRHMKLTCSFASSENGETIHLI